MLRRAAVAGSWYPSSPQSLRAAIDTYLESADSSSGDAPPPDAELMGLIAPHAGLRYSGPVAAHAYRLLRGRTFDLVALVGPSHYVSFQGVSVWPRGAFETPFGALPVDEDAASALIESCPEVKSLPAAHGREHALEMQLPFLAMLVPEVRLLPLVMGHQTRATAHALANGLARIVEGHRALLIASSDLSHYFDAETAADLDAQVVGDVDAFDPQSLMDRLERRREHACGGGPMVSVLSVAKELGATRSRVLRYATSGEVSGDRGSVVGYLAAAMWRS